MATTAGALSIVSVSSTTASLSSAVATAGTAPYTYQWYRSTSTGFSPGPGSLISGATSLTLSQTGLIPNSIYFYVVKATDSSSPAVAANSAQLTVTTLPASLSQNQFAQTPTVGQLDLPYNFNTIAVQVDSSISTGVITQGMAVKVVANTSGGVPRVIPANAITDEVFGFVNFDVKSVNYAAGNMMEISQAGNVMWLYASGAITQGAQVCVDTTQSAAVQASLSTANIVGWAVDGASAMGQLIRVKLSCPSFAFAS